DAMDEIKVGGSAATDRPRGSAAPVDAASAPKAVPIAEVTAMEAGGGLRMATGIGELDRVLGGEQPDGGSGTTAPRNPTRGIVPGSVILVGGDPGVGKSTLMLQA